MLCIFMAEFLLRSPETITTLSVNRLWTLNGFSCVWLCNTMHCNPPSSSVLGILQARILQWVAMLSSRRSSWPRDQTKSLMSPAFKGEFLTTSATWKTAIPQYKIKGFKKIKWLCQCRPSATADIFRLETRMLFKCSMMSLPHPSYSLWLSSHDRRQL